MIPERVRRKRMADGCLSNVVKYALFLTNFLIFVSKFEPGAHRLVKVFAGYTATAKIFLVQKVFTDFLTGTQIDRPFSCFDVAHWVGCYRQAITALGFLIQICFPFNILTLCMLKLFSTFATDAVN